MGFDIYTDRMRARFVPSVRYSNFCIIAHKGITICIFFLVDILKKCLLYYESVVEEHIWCVAGVRCKFIGSDYFWHAENNLIVRVPATARTKENDGVEL